MSRRRRGSPRTAPASPPWPPWPGSWSSVEAPSPLRPARCRTRSSGSWPRASPTSASRCRTPPPASGPPRPPPLRRPPPATTAATLAGLCVAYRAASKNPTAAANQARATAFVRLAEAAKAHHESVAAYCTDVLAARQPAHHAASPTSVPAKGKGKGKGTDKGKGKPEDPSHPPPEQPTAPRQGPRLRLRRAPQQQPHHRPRIARWQLARRRRIRLGRRLVRPLLRLGRRLSGSSGHH